MYRRYSIKILVFLLLIIYISHLCYGLHRIKLAFFHISDVHGYLESHDRKEMANIGGLTYLIDYITLHRKIIKQRGFDVVTFNSGDIFQKSAYGITFKGKATIPLLNMMPIDYTVPGNHELDNNSEFFTNLPFFLKSKILCANIRWNTPLKERILKPYEKKIIKGTRIFFIGLITTESNFMMSPRIGDSIIVTDYEKELNRIFIDEGISSADVVIVLTHCEFSENKMLAEKFSNKIDMIFGGHDHKIISKKIDGIPIIHSGKYGEGFSIIEAEFQRGILYRDKRQYIRVGNRVMASELFKWKKELIKRTGEVVTTGKETLSARNNKFDMNSLSYHVAETIRKASNSDIGMINAGGVREEIPEGDIKIEHVIKVFPYDNYIVKLKIDGKVLKKIVEISIKNMGENGFLHFSGINVSIKKDKTFIVYYKGKPVKDSDKMTIATSDFLTTGGDNFQFLKELKTERFILIRDALIQEVKKHYPFPKMPLWLENNTK